MSDKVTEMQAIVTIDGPAGVGKSTVSRKVAAATGFTYLDTGAMYRGVGWYLQQQGLGVTDLDAIGDALGELDLQLLPAKDEESDVGVIVNGDNISEVIRSPEMGMVASAVSALPVVRALLTKIQREYGEKGNIVAEGRDMGTVVFSGAAYKFFLDAQAEERAKRRCSQLQARGLEADYQQILQLTIQRDKNDSEREVAPLKRADDAVLIDTTEITIQQVVDRILGEIDKKRG